MPPQPLATDYSVQAVVIPRSVKDGKLHVCIAFGIVSPKGPTDPLPTTESATIPFDLKNWPNADLSVVVDRPMCFDGIGTTTERRFQRWWPRDMQGWNRNDSLLAWSSLFADVNFGGIDQRPQGEAVDRPEADLSPPLAGDPPPTRATEYRSQSRCRGVSGSQSGKSHRISESTSDQQGTGCGTLSPHPRPKRRDSGQARFALCRGARAGTSSPFRGGIRARRRLRTGKVQSSGRSSHAGIGRSDFRRGIKPAGFTCSVAS